MIARITVIFGLIVSSVVPFAAQADVLPSTWRFVGSVQDGLGRPLAGAKVVDHYNRTAITNEQGRYVLAMNSTGGRYTLRASRSDTLTATKVVDVDVPYGEVEVDFVPVYRISETVSPYRVTALPATMVLSATTTAPPEGLCVVAKEGQDYHDESGTPISLERDVNDATRWSLTRQLGADLPVGSPLVPVSGVGLRDRYPAYSIITVNLLDRYAGHHRTRRSRTVEWVLVDSEFLLRGYR